MHHKILCDICHEKVATVHYTEIVENKLKKMDLCEECAKEKNIGINIQFSVADILKGLTESHIEKKEETAKKCPFCGLTFSMFRKTGKLGCGACYDAFAEQLLPIIGDIHKNAQHIGTKPAGTQSKKGTTAKNRVKLDELAVQLEEAVRNEKYEDAAVLRDKIKSLQERLEKKGKK